MTHSAELSSPGTVLVTGGTGYLAGWCLYGLLHRGYRVRTTVRDLARAGEVRDALGRAPTTVDLGLLTIVGADLADDAGWDEAVSGCRYVLHTASPFPVSEPKNPDDVIVPARDGTLRVLRAAFAAGVSRIVLTSSTTAIEYGPTPGPDGFDESQWTDLGHPRARAYVRSKTIAERAAWDFVAERDARDRLVTVAPGAMLGPVLSARTSYSVEAVGQLLKRSVPGLPRLGFPVVDVRDVAELHIRAMTSEQAGGHRFIAATTEFRWLADIAQVLRDGLGPAGRRVPTRRLPDVAVRVAALFNPALRQLIGDLGHRSEFNTEAARSTLGWAPGSLDRTIIACAESLLELRT